MNKSGGVSSSLSYVIYCTLTHYFQHQQTTRLVQNAPSLLAQNDQYTGFPVKALIKTLSETAYNVPLNPNNPPKVPALLESKRIPALDITLFISWDSASP